MSVSSNRAGSVGKFNHQGRKSDHVGDGETNDVLGTVWKTQPTRVGSFHDAEGTVSGQRWTLLIGLSFIPGALIGFNEIAVGGRFESRAHHSDVNWRRRRWNRRQTPWPFDGLQGFPVEGLDPARL